MHRLTKRLYYITETLFVRNPLYQLMLVAFVILFISVLGGVIVHLTNPTAYSNTPEAIWWAFLRLTDPGYLGDDRGFFPRLISTILTIAGYVVFLGALVALMTNWLDRTLAFLASGRSPIFEEGHVLIVGWNQRVYALIEELVHTRGHTGQGKAKMAIVILCQHYQPSMYRELMQKLDKSVRDKCRVLIRSGNPLEAESLERVDFAHARSIILVGDDSVDRSSRALSDTMLAKVLMSMKAQAPDLKEPPTVVVEVAKPGNKILIESVGWGHRTEAVVADDIMGRILCQAVRFPGISKVYHRLLTDTFGDSLVLKPAGALQIVGQTLRDATPLLQRGIPIGILPSTSDQSQLKLLDLDTPVKGSDQVVLIISKSPRKIDFTKSETSLLWEKDFKSEVQRKILLVGWSTDLVVLLQELAVNSQEESHVTLLWDTPDAKEKQRLERLHDSYSNLSLSFGETSCLDEREQQIPLAEYDAVVLLADQNQAPLVADAENIMRCLHIHKTLQDENKQAHLVVELNDEDNRVLLKGIPSDILMTSEILSHLLAQVSTHRSLLWIYEELFTKGGAELRLCPLKSILHEKDGSFADCQSACLAANSIALGYYREGKVVFTPHNSTSLLASDDLIVVEMES